MPQDETEKLKRFLRCVPTARWTTVPAIWNEEFRRALSDSLVSVGFGGVLRLTESGTSFVLG